MKPLLRVSIRSAIVSLALLAAFGAGAAEPAANPGPTTNPELEKAHADLKAAWQQTQAAQENLARIESKLGIDSPRALAWEFINNPKRGALGLVFARGHNDPTLKVQAVSPGSAAETAGLREGDTLLSIDKTSLSGLSADDALAELHKLTRTLEVGTAVKVHYSRDGKAADATLVATRPPMFGRHPFDRDGDGKPDGPPHDLLVPADGMESPRGMGPAPGGPPMDDAPLRLVALSPELAPYFKVDGGVLVLSVHAADGEPPTFGLKAGDVIQQIDGQRVGTPMQVFDRLLRAAGSTVKLAGVRSGTPMSLDAAVPTREVLAARIGRHRGRSPFAVE